MKAEYGNWNEAIWEPVRAGIKRVVFGMTAEGMSCTISEVKAGHEAKPHRHPNEQVACIIQGTCDYYVDGTPYAMKPGSWVVIPPEVEHFIQVRDSKEPVLNIDFFVPHRPEYTNGYREFVKSDPQEGH